MACRLTTSQFDEFLARAAQACDVWGPARMPRSGRHSDQEVIGYRPVASLAELVLDRKSFFSPKEQVFPVREILFNFAGNGEMREPEPPRKPLLIFLRACDIHGFDRLDSVFLRNGQAPDFYYERRRKLVKFVLIECPANGFDSCFCVSMGTNRTDDYAAAIRVADGQVLLHVKDADLLPLLGGLPESAEARQ